MRTRRVAIATAALLALFALAQVAQAQAKADPRRPRVVTGVASSVTETAAKLNGTVNPRRSATTAYFEWGTSASYGWRTPSQQVGSGRNSVSVSASLTGLAPGKAYHYRLVATNRSGTAFGAGASFTTSGNPSPSPSPSPSPTTSPTPSPPPTGTTCTNPYFVTTNSNGGVTDGGYYVHNNLWNAARYPGTTGRTEVCSFRSWNHIGTANNNANDGAVKTYPNVHKDYSGRTISSFPALRSRFAATPPADGIWNVGYDLWLNGVPNDEVMIWTENHNQRPAGDIVARGLSISGYSWDLWATSGNGTLTFAAPANTTNGWPANRAIRSGALDLKQMLNYLVSAGRTPANSTVDQICYGVEIVSTNGAPATWRFTDFEITES